MYRAPSARSIFLSTSSARRTTVALIGAGEKKIISIHVLREEDDLPKLSPLPRSRLISIHVLREEDDHPPPHPKPCRKNFYPRPPRGGRPQARSTLSWASMISIHVLREEDDAPPATQI